MSSERRDRALVFDPAFNGDLVHWIATEPRIALRVTQLVEAVRRDPFRGIGKPEPLRQRGPNIWSRPVTEEHRLVYRVEHDRLTFLQARYHYER